MSNQFASRTDKIVDAILAHAERSGELVRGGAADIRRLHPELGRRGPAAAVAEVMAILDGPLGSRWRDPEHEAKGSPLRRILHRLPIDADAVASLTGRWALDANGHAAAGYEAEGVDPARARQLEAEAIGRMVGERLFAEITPATDRTVLHHVPADLRPELPIREQRVRAALDAFASHLPIGADRAALARDLARDVPHGPQHEVNRVVARRIQAHRDLRRTEEPPKFDEYSDARFQPQPDEGADRAREQLLASRMYGGGI